MADNPQKLTEQDRHGKIVIWFDKENIYNGSETSQADREKLINQYYHIAIDFDWLSIIELKKALARKNWLAAQRCYLQFINRHLVSLLNLRYRPERADFGMRYVERDYPIEIIKKLEDFIKISSVEDIEERLPSVLEMFEDLKVHL
ncbi:MAG: hypothetical protein K0B81_04575 [Candidatus Cloacimonetes bacterium]|nr:hypothetical protein [Candidatus Cloacimonadota bacterium]